MARTIMIEGDQKIACPKCNHGFRLSEGISRQAIERCAEDFERSFAERRKRLEDKAREDAKALVREELQTELRSLREAVAAKERVLDKARSEELQLRRQMRELEDAKKAQELDYQRKLDDERKRIESQARSALAEEFSRKEAQFRVQMESVQRELADAKRKAEQASQQLQGEALEVSLESLLRSAFPLDEIVPVPKGMNGADLLQRVRSPSGQCCGTIIWEAKQTKAWQPAWLRKLKDDQQAVSAEVAVIVTAAMPKDRSGNCGEPFVREADVWIARFDAARPLAESLRVALIDLHKARQANVGRSEKMQVLYNYICSPQFTQRVKSVVDGFLVMRQDLEAEKMNAARQFRKREMQLTRMSEGLLGVVGDLQAIGQDGFGELEAVAALPLPDEELADA